MMEIATIVFCITLFGLTIFQLFLILGAPIGNFAWGGSHKVLPTNLRIGSAISIILYAVFAVIVLNKAEVIAFINDRPVIDTGAWVLAVYFVFGVFINGISRSKPERNLMTPVAAILAITTLIIALS